MLKRLKMPKRLKGGSPNKVRIPQYCKAIWRLSHEGRDALTGQVAVCIAHTWLGRIPTFILVVCMNYNGFVKLLIGLCKAELLHTSYMKRKHQQFEDMIIWQEGVKLSCDLYRAIHNSKAYALKDQIIKSSISIPSNIAEGFERQSEKEFVKFLYYAKGSSGELRTQLCIAHHLNILDASFCIEAIAQCRRISAMTQNLISTIERNLM